MALVWAPYEFRIDGETSHCGVDAFSFAKIDGVWKVSNSMWTVEPDGEKVPAAWFRSGRRQVKGASRQVRGRSPTWREAEDDPPSVLNDFRRPPIGGW